MAENSRSLVNKRIQKEIKHLKEHETIRELLCDILAVDLENSDKEKTQYKNKYKEIFDKYTSI